MIKLLRLVSLLLLLTCNDNYLPKPNAFLSLDYPLTNYNDVKFYPKDVSLQYNSAVSSIESINNSNTLISKRINYKEHNASILIDLHEINNNMDLSRILNELNDFTNIHLKKKNSVINVQEYKNESQRLYASIIKIKGDIKFSNHDIFDYDNMLTTTTKENKIVSIENNGSIKILNNTFYEDSNFNIYDNELIINNDNKIWLNSTSKDLPFGDYDSPNTKKSNNSLTLSLYDNQSKNVFIFNKNLEINKNFPIYSLFPADFNYVENDAEIDVIIVDKKNTISLYKINR